eukprot:355490-Chlamydomonas_euryale.AAC.5
MKSGMAHRPSTLKSGKAHRPQTLKSGIANRPPTLKSGIACRGELPSCVLSVWTVNTSGCSTPLRT